MDNEKKFWKSIAFDLVRKTNLGPPQTWDGAQIENFLSEFKFNLEKIIRDDPTKAQIIGIKNVYEAQEHNHNIGISNSTFRKIFHYQTSVGQIQTRNKFAIYLGYESAIDYINKKNIIDTSDIKTKNDPILISSDAPGIFLKYLAVINM